MMKLAVPAAEQAWASTIAAPAASPNLCYEALYNPPSPGGRELGGGTHLWAGSEAGIYISRG